MLTVEKNNNTFRLSGRLDALAASELARRLAEQRGSEDPVTQSWDLQAVDHLDSAAALVLWSFWGGRRPASLTLPDQHRALFERIEAVEPQALDRTHQRRSGQTGQARTGPVATLVGVLTVLGRFALDLAHVIRHPRELPLKETSAACYRSGVSAVPIVCIVGLLIGVVLSYLSSLQLRQYGAESFLPLILGVGVVRELGPMLAAIVIAGRSGSAVTAGLAGMRLTQELDALSALGISHSLRLVLPRTLALIIAMPLLVVCTNAAALLGGMLSGWMELDFKPWAFILGLSRDVAPIHFYIGIFKSMVFGLAIGLIACWFGLSAQANTRSLSTATTRSVVLSISTIILLDATFAILFKDIPG